MIPTSSITKGCFLHIRQLKDSAKCLVKFKSKERTPSHSILSSDVQNSTNYRTFKKIWSDIEAEIELVQRESSRSGEDLIKFLNLQYEKGNLNCNENERSKELLPVATLLSGINQADHYEQFQKLSETIHSRVKCSRSIILQARECPTIKSAVGSMVSMFITHDIQHDVIDGKSLKRSKYSMTCLRNWYEQYELRNNTKLIVIIPDFEVYNSEVLKSLIYLICSNCSSLPFILILGIATDMNTFYNTLSYDITRQILIEDFITPPSTVILGKILENVILSPKCPILLSGKMFLLLTDIFLFYDMNINGFIQGLKQCIMDFYNQDNRFSLCTAYDCIDSSIDSLSSTDIEMIRRLPSFRVHVESCFNDCQKVISLLTDIKYMRVELKLIIRQIHRFIFNFHCFLRILVIMLKDLPRNKIGKQLRDVYALCAATSICDSHEFSECWKFIAFQSKEELMEKLNKCMKCLLDLLEHWSSAGSEIFQYHQDVRRIVKRLEEFKNLLLKSDMTVDIATQSNDTTHRNINRSSLKVDSRQELKEKLLNIGKQPKFMSEFQNTVSKLMIFFKDEVFGAFLKPFSCGPPLIDIFISSDVATLRRQIIGASRGAIHGALTNPYQYLLCNCCKLENKSQLLPSLPDIAIVYKLHLECGAIINLYDWLVAFNSVVEDSEVDSDTIDTKIQARFTLAVAELQFLGYIKSSNKKTDHVMRLTW